jgi:hypothetical protein
MFSFMTECSKKRKEQFVKQRSHDKIIETLECKNVVISYLLSQRRINRERTISLFESSILDYFSETRKNLELIDMEYDILEKCLKEKSACECLK